jgi:hypothetical protein
MDSKHAPSHDMSERERVVKAQGILSERHGSRSPTRAAS